MSWEAISSVSTFVGTIIILITAVFGVMQLVEMQRSRKLELMWKLFDELASLDAREKRAFIYSELPDNPSQLTKEHLLVIDEVLSKMDMAWILVEHGQLDPSYIYDTYGQVFLRLWNKLYPFVIYERERRGEYYRKRTELLINEIKLYFQKQGQPTDYRTSDLPAIKNSGKVASTRISIRHQSQKPSSRQKVKH